MAFPPSISPQQNTRGSTWSKEEDAQLIFGMHNCEKRKGEWPWTAIAKQMPCPRTAKQCRERWSQQLNPLILRTNFSEDEKHSINDWVIRHGHQWARLSRYWHGRRSDNQIKNWYYSSANKPEHERIEEIRKHLRHCQQYRRPVNLPPLPHYIPLPPPPPPPPPIIPQTVYSQHYSRGSNPIPVESLLNHHDDQYDQKPQYHDNQYYQQPQYHNDQDDQTTKSEMDEMGSAPYDYSPQ